jgi:hypothetical protein
MQSFVHIYMCFDVIYIFLSGDQNKDLCNVLEKKNKNNAIKHQLFYLLFSIKFMCEHGK